MKDHEPFIAAVVDDVDSDTPRLRYADFLDELGDEKSIARAEFIRVQCALAGTDAKDPQLDPLRTDERRLLERHWRDWLADVCKSLNEVSPRPPKLVATQPKPWYQFWRKEPPVAPPMPERYGIRFDPLHLPRGHVILQHAIDFGEAAGAFYLADLQARAGTFNFGGTVNMIPSFRPYLDAACFGRGFVDFLRIYVGPQRPLNFLERTLRTRPVTALHLSGLTPEDLSYLLAEGRMRSIREFGLCEQDHFLLPRLVESRESAKLRSLYLEGVHEMAIVEALVEAPYLTGLRKLVFTESAIDADMAVRLIESDLMMQLEELEITRLTEPCEPAVEALLHAPQLDSLQKLRLGIPNAIHNFMLLRERFGKRLEMSEILQR